MKELTFNIKNCILYRKREKEILHYFKDVAERVNKLVNLSQKQAKKEVNSWSLGKDS
jgi:hypothetical protein